MKPDVLFFSAAGCYFLSFAAAWAPGRWRNTMWLFLLPGLFANAALVFWRYSTAWPLMPMYLGPATLPLCLGLLITLNRRRADDIRARRFVLGLTLFLAVAAFLFPKDFYLPFLKSNTPASHLFFLFKTLGQACFLFSAAWAWAGLLSGKPQQFWLRWAVWGFAFWTLCMFSGMLWSYLGWGSPVVWGDAAITLIMATWFFYISLLHLHLTGTWTAQARAAYAASGAFVVVTLSFVPDLGPLRWPF